VPWSHARDSAFPRGTGDLAFARRGIHDLFPVFPVPIADEHGDRAANRLARAHAGQELRGVALDLHASSAPVPLLSAREVGVDVRSKQWDARRHPFEDADERLPVGLTSGGEAKHWKCGRIGG